MSTPQSVPQVMLSSTFTDLKEHRQALIAALPSYDLHPNAMESDAAKLTDVIDSSLEKVRQSAAYIGVISSVKYGQTPECSKRNPQKLSLTELEFNEAQRLKRPTLIFIMDEEHPVKKADFETDPEKQKKLETFRECAKKTPENASVERVYTVFNSLEEFKDRVGPSLNSLTTFLKASTQPPTGPEPTPAPENTIPRPPAFYAEPDYIGSHKFVGRTRELEELSDWANPADPTNLLLFEAIGGNGKSMLTWEWTNNHATTVRDDWAGRFWFSFYEQGADMAEFCRHALAYMTGKSLKDFAKKKTTTLSKDLLAELHAKPWLLILDGLERVLVAYHRIDAAEVLDEEANTPTDKIVDRNPCDAIREEDNDLLRALSAAAPSKILVSSRLTPRVLLNPSNQPITGARRITLPGLRPAYAESLLRSCGITGDSAAIQKYLTTNCDNHPLVIGVLGGLINQPGKNRGNFDAWVADSNEGGALNLAELDLVQRRNNILSAAIDALPQASHQLLSTLALISDSVDYETLEAFNPHLLIEPEKEKSTLTAHELADIQAASKQLEATVIDLEQRGLLQWDEKQRRYDLHPVVRGVASGSMKKADQERHGQRVVDYFSAQPHRPYDEAETTEDVRAGLNVVRTLLKLGRLRQAADTYLGDLSNALLFNLENNAEILSLLKEFFPNGWQEIPSNLTPRNWSYMANQAGIVLKRCNELKACLKAYHIAIESDIAEGDWKNVRTTLSNISTALIAQNRLAHGSEIESLALEIANETKYKEAIFMTQISLFGSQCRLGQWKEAANTKKLLEAMGRDWSRNAYRPGNLECHFATFYFSQGTLNEQHITIAEQLAIKAKNRGAIRSLHRLRGKWQLEQNEWTLAAESYQEALRMARERGITDGESETGLALVRCKLGQLPSPNQEAERLAQLRNPTHRFLAQLWQTIGDLEKAKHHALAAYKWAWADGEPYVHRYELDKSQKLLQSLGIPIPDLPPYDPAKYEPFPWEADVRAAIEKLKAEKEK